MARFVATYGPVEARIRTIESHLALLGDSPINAAQEANAITLTANPGSGAQFVSLDTLDDTNLSSPAAGDALIYDGTDWVNSAAYITTAPLTATRNTILAGDGIQPLILSLLDTGGGADRAALRPTLLNLIHHTTLATVPGVGGAIDWTAQDDAAADQTLASVIGEITGVTAGALEATVGVVVKHQNQDCEVVRFRGQSGMAATNVGSTLALKGYIGGQMWVRGNALLEGLDGNVASITDAGTTNTVIPLTLKHLTTGAAAAGLGVELDFVNQNSAGVATVTGFLQSLYTGGTTGAENGSVIFGAIYGGARVEVARFRATGMAVVGGVGGQFFCRGDFLHAGTSFSVFNAPQIGQLGAYTLTGSATRTFPADPSAAYTGAADGEAKLADLNTLRTTVSSLIGVVRQLATDAGKTSGFGFNAT